MNLLISFDAHSIPESKDGSIEAYKEFYESLAKLCLRIDHPYNNPKIPRSTCFLEVIYIENIDKFKEALLEKAKENKLKIQKLCIMKVQKDEYEFKIF
ncbi:hypothetical protein KQY10_13630 [Leptospira interrogans]|uniref:hypothetical protein n=1 Tax=Leptospira interrogans TaxID=173 RepID=UPI000375B1B4|nr:hypothetical protein [Leptospira interrogans]MCD1166623.1 hypothetical protein [Leptospira interrogans]MCH1885154.1 hypothetical protein [Leptospira interrogans]MCH1891400.1 hypothetical protein [Leptospira interrogans]MCH1898194.1 hypothetical protein [Leptospira interrogans]MCH1901577.1 hypothetical protein [Leptospira interrogans]